MKIIARRAILPMLVLFICIASALNVLAQPVPAPIPNASDYPLPPGREPGTFLFTYSGQVRFTQEPAFPVLVSIDDYARQPIFTAIVGSPAPFLLSKDLPPGSYLIESQAGPGRRDIYWNAFGPQIFIDRNGRATAGMTLYGRDLVHERKLAVADPNPSATVTEKRPLLRWQPLPGAVRYRVIWSAEDAPDHAVAHGQGDVTEPEFRFTEDTAPGRRYRWSLHAFDSHGQRLGYFTTAAFYTTGDRAAFQPPAPLPALRGQSWLGIISSRATGSARGIFIHTVGANTPAINAGLQPQDILTRFDGHPLDNVTEAQFTALVRAYAPGARVPVEYLRRNTRHATEITLEAMP